jgi:hypothetical protein
MARNSTLYQCFNFLARSEATIGCAPHPDDPCKNRLTIRIGETVAAIEYSCTEEMDFLDRILKPICRTLEGHLENEAKNE